MSKVRAGGATEQSDTFWHRPTEVEKGASWHAYEGQRGASLCGQYMLVGLGYPKDKRRRVPVAARCKTCVAKWKEANG